MANQPMYKKIYDDLAKKLADHVYLPGDQLPTETELCVHYAVSRITIKKALELLSNNGFIDKQRGKGSFVRATPLVLDNPTRPERTIAYIVTEFYSFSNIILHTIEQSVSRRGDHLILKTTQGNSLLEKKYIRQLISKVDGFIILPTQNQFFNEEILKLVVEKIPFVLIDRILKGIPTVTISTNNTKASEELIGSLIQDEKKRIGLVSSKIQGTSSIEGRLNGYETALQKNGLTIDKRFMLTNISSTIPHQDTEENITSDLQKIKQYLQKNKGKLDAIFAIEYHIALLIERARQELSDEDLNAIEIVCFDEPHSIYLPGARFTHIQQDEQQIAKIAVDKLYRMFEAPLEPETILVDGIFVKKDRSR
ncbi:MAG: GntR family transcriptional regulator [Sporolactobacillus sp.]